MSDAEQIMATVWGRIIDEVRQMRDNKYTLERIGSILGVAKPTVQRWLENNAGGEKTAFIDILRYLKALDLDLGELLYPEGKPGSKPGISAEELEKARADKQQLSSDLIRTQQELLQARQRIIDLQEKVLGLEKLNTEIADKARKAIIAAAQGKRLGAGAVAQPVTVPGKRRLEPGQFPDLPPIHLKQEK